ncbi:MAG: hypothetical protein HYY16_09645 [Planctomycetes bacterium]|nr:hypothetical protein [Planctomycetota bacterium]
MRWIFVLLLLIPLSLSGCGLIGFHYPNFIDNEPLENPVRVRAIVGEDLLELDDGRRVRLDEKVPLAESLIRASDNLVDIEPRGTDPDGVMRGKIYVKFDLAGHFCGTPWAQLIRIPLFADNIDRYARLELRSHR